MFQRTHSLKSEAWRIVGHLEGNQTQIELVKAIGIAQNVILIIWIRFLEIENARRRQE